jgi:hypothetical protein
MQVGVSTLDFLSITAAWATKVLLTWLVAAIIGGVLIAGMDGRARRAEPSDNDVKRAATRYLEYFGEDAVVLINDHIIAASFSPDGRHRRFLKRVHSELWARNMATKISQRN